MAKYHHKPLSLSYSEIMAQSMPVKSLEQTRSQERMEGYPGIVNFNYYDEQKE